MKKHKTVGGKTLDLTGLTPAEHKFLRLLKLMAKSGANYFDIARTAVGAGSPALGGRFSLDRRTAETPLYLAAEDIATRAGIEQGLILAPEHESRRKEFPTDGSHISVTQAAEHIGISRAAVYKAIQVKKLKALHIGNVTVVDKQSAIEYKKDRETGTPVIPISKKSKKSAVTVKRDKRPHKEKAA